MKLRHISLIFLILISGLLAQELDASAKGIAEQLTKNIKRLDRNHATGVASHITLETPLVHEGDIESHADRFFSEYPFFGVHEFKNELKLTTKQKDPHFAKRFSAVFEQHHKGLRVFGSQIRLHFNDDHYITGADGTFIADLHNLNTDISIDQATATEIAKNHFKEKYDVNDFVVGDVELMVYREGINSGRKGDNYVAWMCVVSDQQMRRDRIFVNAKSGEVIVVIPLVHSIRREAWEGAYLVGSPFWVEGDAFPTNNTDANLNLNVSLAVYTAFQNAFNWTSYDDNDAKMIMVFDLQDNGTNSICPNAFWNGTVYASCPGVNAWDVAAHEWGHAYDQYSANLTYFSQSGAMNEGFADIIGETIQLLFNISYPLRNDTCGSGDRWIIGEELLAIGINGTGIRDMYNPNCFGDPRSVNDTQYVQCGTADNEGVHTNSGIIDQLYSISVDGGTLNNITVSGVGLIKGFHIYMRTMLVKLQPNSDFAFLATALQSSCNDLIGLNLTDPVTGNITANSTISATDCLSIQDAINATQLTSPFCVNGTNSTAQKPDVLTAFPPIGETGNISTTVYFLSSPMSIETLNATCMIQENNGTNTTVPAQLRIFEFFYLYSCQLITSNSTNTTLFITISADGVNFSDRGLTFNFTSSVNVTSITPTTGPAVGGTNVTVFGNNFELFTGCQPFPATDVNGDSYDCLTCIFGNNINRENPVKATFINSTAVSCMAPSFFNLVQPNRTVSVWVSKNGQLFHTNNTAAFTYNVTVTTNSPTPIPISGSRSRTRTAIPISRSRSAGPATRSATRSRSHVVSPSRAHSTTPTRFPAQSQSRLPTRTASSSSFLSPSLSFILVTFAVLFSICLF